ncbi:UNVERIFIED_CONTAM: Cellulose synthase-like protein E6 [Sesamum calycinum]|uniref:Cellulose synthase-like protein E6 n=1 Tax=Sesamum calycinum TaxID=2727403 RepID=A0AAW2R9B0_9LAMI
MENSLPLSVCRVKKTELVINRLHAVLHGIALLALFYYRLSSLAEIIKNNDTALLLPTFSSLISELIFSFIWLFSQATKWKPVTRKAYPDRLPGDEKLPSIDVFVCTTDPNKEPCVKVMNTVISAMTLDYPPDKLQVYLSDDGGSVVTFQALKQAWKFSKLWVPFCKKYKVKIGCPEAYFSTDESGLDATFHSSEFIAERRKSRYMEFKESVTKNLADTSIPVSRDHPPIIEVMNDENGDGMDSDKRKIPLLVYVAREKRPSHPHHFKAGALNVLVNILSLYEFTFSISPTFFNIDLFHHNLCIYSLLFRTDVDLIKLQKCFGPSNEFIKSISLYYKRNYQIEHKFRENEVQKELQLLASCTYDNDSEWGKRQVGFRYISVVEDYFTGFIMHCKGWISVYFDPSKPGFFGEIPISLGEILVQQTRWSVGFYQVTLSSPHSSTLPNTWHFSVPRAQLKHVQEVFLTGHSIRTWSNEQRMWMMKALTSYLFAGLEVVMEKIGLTKTSFLPTNKVDDDQQTKCYQMGYYNFQAPARFMVPLCSLYMLNVGSLIIGFGRIMQTQKWGEMLLQALIPLFATVLHFPLLEGMVLRKDKGRVSPSVFRLSAVISTIFLSFASLLCSYY